MEEIKNQKSLKFYFLKQKFKAISKLKNFYRLVKQLENYFTNLMIKKRKRIYSRCFLKKMLNIHNINNSKLIELKDKLKIIKKVNK